MLLALLLQLRFRVDTVCNPSHRGDAYRLQVGANIMPAASFALITPAMHKCAPAGCKR
jgi:hypothetical protein